MTRTHRLLVATVSSVLLGLPDVALAYVGPGAGFAFVSSIFIIIFTTFLAFLTLLTWPIRWAVQRIRGSKALAAARVRRVVVLGLDGQDPELTEQFMREGLLPNFARLRDQGTFVPLQTTLLAESPVAWTSFQTGCNPGKHRIFDFLVPNRRSHLPELCSACVEPPRRTLPIGPFRIPLGKPTIRAGRRSQPFWKILGDHGIFSTVLRVPITFPAEALVKAFVRDAAVLADGVALETAGGLTVETPGVRIPSTREVAWRVRADTPGAHELVVRVGEESVDTRLVAGDRWGAVTQRRTGRGVWDTLLYPGELPIPRTHTVEAVEIVYPPLELRALGWTIHWLVAFFVLSIAFGFAFKDALGVEV